MKPHISRRSFVAGAVAVPAVAFLGSRFGPLSGQSAAAGGEVGGAVLTAADLTMPPGTPYPLVSLPGKGALGQLYDRPPNYEVPAEKLIGQKNYPYTDNEYYYVRYREANVLELTPENYSLKVGGESAAQEVSFSLDDLIERASLTLGAVGSCTGEGVGLHQPMLAAMPWTKGDVSCAEWTGVPIKDLLEEAGFNKETAKFVSFGGGRVISLKKPQYWRAYPIETMLAGHAMLAVKMNGEDIPFWNGYPVRLVVPGSYSPTWTKQVVEMQVGPTPHPMEWSGRKVTPNSLKLFSLISTPTDGTKIPRGRKVELTGVAYDKGVGITKVEISQDEGATWAPGTLEKSYGKYTWRVWHATVGFDATGEQRVLSRATNAEGDVQEMEVSAEVQENAGRKETSSRHFAAVFEVV